MNKYCAEYRTDSHPVFSPIKRHWDGLFRSIIKTDAPTKIKPPECCAQFVVSRDAIYKYSLNEYKTWLDYIFNHWYDDDDTKPNDLGAAFEYLWHVIFGDDDFVTNYSCKDNK